MFELSRTYRLAILGVAAPTMVGLLYWLIKTSQDDDEETIEIQKSPVVTSRQTIIELPVPRKLVGTIIGRQGATIKDLQEKSGAKMNFKDDTNDDRDRIIVIRGTPETAQAAECMIRKMLTDLPVVVQDTMNVPSYALGRIIGKGGENVRQMSRASNTKIFIDRTKENYRDQPRLITISGTKEHIIIAKSMLQEKLDEEEEFRAKAAVSAANRETRKQHPQSNHKPHLIQDSSVNMSESAVKQTGNAKNFMFPMEREFVEVYVSAIANPDVFWVQLIGSMALQLDNLSEQMTIYYETVGKEQTVSSVKKGDIVAAPFENDRTWYRARVMEVKGSEIDVFYVDYGDSAYLDISNVRALGAEYQSLPFQAIECRLDGVRPTSDGGWSEEAFEKFEELSYCTKWKVIIAKLVQYVKDKPSIRLIDTNGDKDVDIGDELVRLGVAVAMETPNTDVQIGDT